MVAYLKKQGKTDSANTEMHTILLQPAIITQLAMISYQSTDETAHA